MIPTSGQANDPANGSTNAVQQFGPPPSDTIIPTALTPTAAKIKELIADLEVPFHPSVIEWRVTNTSKGGSPRGQVMPYADQRAYTDRLNALFTLAGWTRRYTIHTRANFERSKDKKIVAKVLVTCELTIFGLGSHSATGEEWADDDNAATAAEAQSFKRACSCFGLGRYLYYFTGTWVDLDERKRPKSVPKLDGWPRRMDGGRVCGPTRRLPRDCPSKHLQATAGMAMAMTAARGRTTTVRASCARLNRWNDQWASACIADCLL
jgi:hypothetical protein